MALQRKLFFEFSEFRIDPAERLLLQNGQTVSLTPKAFDTLLVLVENRGRLIEKDELMQAIWPDTFVEEAGLTRNISSLRKALGEVPGETSYIETIPRRGYRFVAEVKETWEESSASEKGEEDSIIDTNAEKTPPPRVFASSRARMAVVVSLAVALTAAVIYFMVKAGAPQPASTPKPSTLAVLPFKVVGASPETEHLGVGMTDTLITALSSVRDMRVLPTSSVLKYDGTDESALSVGQALRVDTVLEGTIQQAGDRIRVTVRLMNVKDESPLWSGKFDEDFKDYLDIQDSISERVTSALALRLTSEDRSRLTKQHTKNAEAYQLYLKGRYFWNKRTRDGYRKAIELFNEAINKDPSYALAYAGLADCYVLGGDARSTEEAFSKAKEAAMKAISLDDTLAEAHASFALTRMAYDWNLAAAEEEFRRAIALNPNYPTAHQWHADCLILMGQIDEAIASVRRAQELDPLSLIISRDAGRVFYFARRYDEAIEQCKKTLEMDPGFYPARITLGDAYVQEKAYDEAIAEYNNVISLSGGRSRMRASLAYVYARSGRNEEARRALSELIETVEGRPASAFDLATAYTGLGDKDSAFKWLEAAYSERSYRLIYMLVDPVFDPLRSDERFAELASRITSSSL
ncbi:MAG TPA: tetratricopeptide repeat protein [Blastocatellia bacterium]|jgi:DNA-binding winged helix-turn-helix (wHTH) protein/TolB-like protein/thioredoxin-like negative regulator of GroEL